MIRRHIYVLDSEEIQKLDEIIISERKHGYILVDVSNGGNKIVPFHVMNFTVDFIHKSNYIQK